MENQICPINSYKFYEDGYVKNHWFLTLILKEIKDERRYEYFTARLFSFYQQQYLFNKKKKIKWI